MRDITAVLIHYTDENAKQKALHSLAMLSHRLESIVLIQEMNVIPEQHPVAPVHYVSTKHNDLGATLRNTISKISSEYVLFLQSPNYLSADIKKELLHLSDPQKVLVTNCHPRNKIICIPFLVRTSLLKEKPLLSSRQVPFDEALLPSWLFKIKDFEITCEANLINQTIKSNSRSTLEKQRFIQKYQLKETSINYPSLSVIMSVYNMQDYAETAAVSSLFQMNKPEQLLIMDDGSTDQSYRRLKQWDNDKKVTVFHKKNDGKAKALNQLLPHVTSDFILELDADDWLDQDAVYNIKCYLAGLPSDASLLYGNIRKWKQSSRDLVYKGVSKGKIVKSRSDLLSYNFPLAPRIYRTSALKHAGGFPVIDFKDGRLYEDVSVLDRLLQNSRFQYHDFTVYNVREHKGSITKNNRENWNAFLKTLKNR